MYHRFMFDEYVPPPSMNGGGICILGMGDCGSETKITNISNQLYINKSTYNQLNEQLNQTIANTIVKNAMKSGGDVINKQELKFKNIQAQGDVEINGVSQTQTAAITFDTMNKTEARNDAATQFIQQALSSLKNMSTDEVVNKMESNATAKVNAGFLTIPTGSSKTDVTNTTNIASETDNVKNITNILKNQVDNNFTTETVTSCIINVNNTQLIDVQDVKSETGSVRILNLSQDQSVTLISKCTAITDATGKILDNTLNALDVKVDETNSVKATTTNTTTAASTNTTSGLFDSMWSTFAIIGIVIAVVIAIVIIVYVVYNNSNSNVGTSVSNNIPKLNLS